MELKENDCKCGNKQWKETEKILNREKAVLQQKIGLLENQIQEK